MKETEKFASFKKTHGPPHYSYSASYDPLEKNEYLLSKGVDVADLKKRNPQHLLEAWSYKVQLTGI